MWNHYDSIRRTNNNIEGYHSSFNKLVKTKNPNIFYLITKIKILHNSTIINLIRARNGSRQKQKNIEVEKNLTYELLKTQFNQDNKFEEYLNALSIQIQYPYSAFSSDSTPTPDSAIEESFISIEQPSSQQASTLTDTTIETTTNQLTNQLTNITDSQPCTSSSLSTDNQPTRQLLRFRRPGGGYFEINRDDLDECSEDEESTRYTPSNLIDQESVQRLRQLHNEFHNKEEIEQEIQEKYSQEILRHVGTLEVDLEVRNY